MIRPGGLPAVLATVARGIATPAWHRRWVAAGLVVAGVAVFGGAGGCSDEVVVRLRPIQPVAGGSCGRVPDARMLLLTALGDFPPDQRSLAAEGVVELGDLPAETRQIAVEILGLGAAKPAIGKTAPFELARLRDGAELPILMLPPDGVCPVGNLSEPRAGAIAVAAGEGVLVVGGIGPEGPLLSADWYDPSTGHFSRVEIPAALSDPRGLRGTAATPLADGRVVLSGGPRPAYAVFSPATRQLGAPRLLPTARAYHAAVALDDHRVLLAGGCALLDEAGACQRGSAIVQSEIIDVNAEAVRKGPTLALARIGGTASIEAAGDDLVGPIKVLLVGGVDDGGGALTRAERVDPDGVAAGELVEGAGMTAVALDGGATLTTDLQRAASVVVPAAAPAKPVAAVPVAGATLTLLENGGVLALGAATAARYLPARHSWRSFTVGGEGRILDGHAALRLPDGSVLVAGGRDGGQPVDEAYVFRPALTGPFTGAVIATPGSDREDVLTPLDPSLFDFDDRGGWRVRAAGASLRSWAVITGPRPLRGSLTATVETSIGVAVLLGQVSASRFDVVELVPGALARLVRHRDGMRRELCQGAPVILSIVGSAIRVVRSGRNVIASVNGEAVLDCSAADPEAGLWGLAPLGDGATLVIRTLELSR